MIKLEMMNNTFTTDRLTLEPLAIDDAGFILELLNTAGFITFIGDRQVRTLSAARDYVEKILANPDIRYWVVKLTSTGELLGTVTSIRRVYLDYPDIGYAFLPAFTKMGYAFEAAAVVLQGLLNANHEILATTVLNNLQSKALLLKLGFTFIKQINVEGEDLLLYQILAIDVTKSSIDNTYTF
jgi:ribosomal-protein-alanine N-acetyltransferase